jgi:hypothetical protein
MLQFLDTEVAIKNHFTPQPSPQEGKKIVVEVGIRIYHQVWTLTDGSQDTPQLFLYRAAGIRDNQVFVPAPVGYALQKGSHPIGKPNLLSIIFMKSRIQQVEKKLDRVELGPQLHFSGYNQNLVPGLHTCLSGG